MKIIIISLMILALSTTNLFTKDKIMNKNLQIEFQHFEGCPNGPSLLKNLEKATEEFKDRVIVKNIIIDSPELAKKHHFLGSPTILIDGIDIEGLELPKDPNLTCRVYKNGVPSVEFIKNKIKSNLEK